MTESQAGLFETQYDHANQRLVDVAPSRASDPETSRNVVELSLGRRAVLYVFQYYGEPMSDDVLIARLRILRATDPARFPALSPSGARTRRSELVKLGLIVHSGLTTATMSKRRAVLWMLTPKGKRLTVDDFKVTSR